MQASEIQALLASEMADADIDVQGQDGKYLVKMVSSDFEGLSAVKRQQLVYRVLNPHISSGAIHAVSMELNTPGEARA